MTSLFPTDPSITVYDPLAHLLGTGDGHFRYTFDDAVKLAGHACPTIAGAFVMALKALRALYGDDIPRRGAIRIAMPGPVDEGVNGPISQVFTLLTGAAAENGFHGLAHLHRRKGLMTFAVDPAGGFRFERLDNGTSVTVHYDPSSIPSNPDITPLLQRILQDGGGEEVRDRFGELWRNRVLAILEDAGESTVRLDGIAIG